MPSTAVVTVVRMMESLPEATQQQVVEHLRDYLQDLQDEALWDETYNRTQDKIVGAARQAKRDIAAGKAKPLDPGQL
jgi:hypothetical protein